MRMSDISAAAIDEFKAVRLAEKVEPATINHNVRVLRRILYLAERKRLLARTPFIEVDFLKQRRPRFPHIVTFEEEERIVSAAPSFLRALIVLILETGLRSHRDGITIEMVFYEKVIKVKADVAAFLISCFPFHLSIGITLRW